MVFICHRHSRKSQQEHGLLSSWQPFSQQFSYFGDSARSSNGPQKAKTDSNPPTSLYLRPMRVSKSSPLHSVEGPFQQSTASESISTKSAAWCPSFLHNLLGNSAHVRRSLCSSTCDLSPSRLFQNRNDT